MRIIYNGLEVSCLQNLCHIKESRMASATKLPVFTLAELANKYPSCLTELGEDTTGCIHTTRLKDRILKHIPALEEYEQECDVFLAFKTDLANTLQKVHKKDCDEEVMHFAKAAIIACKDMLAKKYTFDGYFGPNCQVNSIPVSLLLLISMIPYGLKIDMQVSSSSSQATLTTSQLLQSNSYHRCCDGDITRE